MADTIVAEEALDAILQSTRMDMEQPCTSQWAIVLLRNVCEWSGAAREHIAALKRVHSDGDAANAHMQEQFGLRVEEMGDGKIKISSSDEQN